MFWNNSIKYCTERFQIAVGLFVFTFVNEKGMDHLPMLMFMFDSSEISLFSCLQIVILKRSEN